MTEPRVHWTTFQFSFIVFRLIFHEDDLNYERC